MGDANNKYFTPASKERTHRKQIIELTALQGTRLTHQQEIRDEIQSFYMSLMGSAKRSLPAVNKEIIRKGPVIRQQKAIALCQPISNEEIYAGLKSIDDDEAPRGDSYNALFYKKNFAYNWEGSNNGSEKILQHR